MKITDRINIHNFVQFIIQKYNHMILFMKNSIHWFIKKI